MVVANVLVRFSKLYLKYISKIKKIKIKKNKKKKKKCGYF